MAIDKSSVQATTRQLLDPLAGLILRMGFSPDALTLLGLVLSIISAYSLSRGRLVGAAIFLLAGGLCDILDGSMARRSGRSSSRGAFLDSTLDRLSEIVVFIGLFVYYRERLPMALLTMVALTGSLMTSYTRARAEGLGETCKVGLLERPERLVLLIAGLLLAPLRIAGWGVLELVIAALALLTYFTTFQRILHVVAKTGGGRGQSPRADSGEGAGPAERAAPPPASDAAAAGEGDALSASSPRQ